MPRDFLDKKLTTCPIKAFDAYRAGTAGGILKREDMKPEHCKYASEGARADDPVCEVVRRRIADMSACPLESPDHASMIEDTAPQYEPDLFKKVLWTKTQ